MVLATGILYRVFIGRHLLPVRQSPGDSQVKVELRKFVSELRVLNYGKLAGSTLLESKLGQVYDLTVIVIVRGDTNITKLERDTIINSNDILLIEGSPDNISRAKSELGMEIAHENIRHAELDKLSETEMGFIEATLAPQSSIANRSSSVVIGPMYS